MYISLAIASHSKWCNNTGWKLVSRSLWLIAKYKLLHCATFGRHNLSLRRDRNSETWLGPWHRFLFSDRNTGPVIGMRRASTLIMQQPARSVNLNFARQTFGNYLEHEVSGRHGGSKLLWYFRSCWSSSSFSVALHILFFETLVPFDI